MGADLCRVMWEQRSAASLGRHGAALEQDRLDPADWGAGTSHIWLWKFKFTKSK